MESLYTSSEVRGILKISQSTFCRMLRSGALRGYKIKGRGRCGNWRFTREDITTAIQRVPLLYPLPGVEQVG